MSTVFLPKRNRGVDLKSLCSKGSTYQNLCEYLYATLYLPYFNGILEVFTVFSGVWGFFISLKSADNSILCLCSSELKTSWNAKHLLVSPSPPSWTITKSDLILLLLFYIWVCFSMCFLLIPCTVTKTK